MEQRLHEQRDGAATCAYTAWGATGALDAMEKKLAHLHSNRLALMLLGRAFAVLAVACRLH